MEKIKFLENIYFIEGNKGEIRIPIPSRSKLWGNPLFRIELIWNKRNKKSDKRYFIRQIIVGIPHLEKEGCDGWRKIECHTPAIALGVSIAESHNGRWFFTELCAEHLAPRISIYPPSGAKFLRLSNLFTGIGSDLGWEF